MKEKAIDETRTRQDHPMPYRYLAAIIFLLFIFVLGVLIPDLMPYLGPKFGLVTPSHSEPISPPSASGNAIPAMNLFETYARFVTLFLALVSVLGVFFGYFVRRSIKDTEDDMEKRLDRTLSQWKVESESLKSTYKAISEKLEEKLKSVEALEKRLTKALSDWDVADKRYSTPPSSSSDEVKKTSTRIDAEISDALETP